MLNIHFSFPKVFDAFIFSQHIDTNISKDILSTGCEDVCGKAPEPDLKEINALGKVLNRKRRDVKSEVL